MALSIRTNSASQLRAKAHLVAQAKFLSLDVVALHEFVREQADRNPFLKLKSKLSSQVHLLDQQAVSSLWTDLRNQIENSFANQEQLGIAQFCLESLDEAGRLPENIIVLLTQKGFERKLIQRVIERLQEFGPPGVFGVGMVGQYRLQLFALGFGPKDLPLRLLGHWQDLLSKGLGPVAAMMGEDVGACRDGLELLVRHGHPISMNEYAETPVPPEVEIQTIQPPQFVFLNDVSSQVEFDHHLWAKSRGEQVGEEMLQAKHDADRIVSALIERRRIMVEILNHAIMRQERYFLEPNMPIQPLTMAQLAEHVGVAVSTISRMASHLLMIFEGRVISLRSLFASPVGRDAPVSGKGLMHELRKHVAQEEWPLTDQQLQQQIDLDGWAPSLSSIGKYRRLAGIPDVRARRAWVRHLPHESRYWLESLRMV